MGSSARGNPPRGAPVMARRFPSPWCASPFRRSDLDQKVNETGEQNTANCLEQKLRSISGDDVGRKRDHRRKTGAAFWAEPNVTGVLIAPILGPYGRNQLSIAVNATHQHGDPHSAPETRSDCPLQTTSKLRITCGRPDVRPKPMDRGEAADCSEYRQAAGAIAQSVWKNCARLLSATAVERVAVISGVTVVPNARIAGVALTGLHSYKAVVAMGKTLEPDGGERVLPKQE